MENMEWGMIGSPPSISVSSKLSFSLFLVWIFYSPSSLILEVPGTVFQKSFVTACFPLRMWIAPCSNNPDSSRITLALKLLFLPSCPSSLFFFPSSSYVSCSPWWEMIGNAVTFSSDSFPGRNQFTDSQKILPWCPEALSKVFWQFLILYSIILSGHQFLPIRVCTLTVLRLSLATVFELSTKINSTLTMSLTNRDELNKSEVFLF